MKLEHIQITNLRSCKNVKVLFRDYTCLVGPNGAGKSTVLNALNIFFREKHDTPGDVTRLVEEDFHQKNTDDPITVALTFTDLDAAAKNDFKGYWRNEKLIVSAEATYDPAKRYAEVKRYGERLGMQEFARFFEAEGDGEKVAELKKIYADIKNTNFDTLPPPGTKDAMKKALRDYESANPERCVLLRSDDQFFGVSQGTDKFAKHIQWVYVPAVKDASTEQVEQKNTALAALLARTVRAKTKFTGQVAAIRDQAHESYAKLLEDNQATLDGLSGSLQSRLANWAHPEATLRLEWWQDPNKAVTVQEPAAQIIAGEDQFEGQLFRLGHGLQRSYLLALLQELATAEDDSGPTLLLGCEEPELYQHPPQVRHLCDVFQELSTQNAQIIVSTHSPLIVRGDAFENVRVIRKSPAEKATFAAHVTYDQIARAVVQATGKPLIKPEGIRAKLTQTLQANVNEMFFAQRLILVEGLEDIAYITAHLHVSDRWDEYRRLGCHMIQVGGKSSIIQPLAIANALHIYTVVVFDSDAHNYGPSKLEADEGKRRSHERDNKAILALCGITTPEPFPAQTLFHDDVVMWHSEIGDVVKDDIGPENWSVFRDQTNRELGQPGGLNKNSIQIAMSLAKAWEDGKRSSHLDRLCDAILKVPAKAVKPSPPLAMHQTAH